ncbi:carbon monoxide dehydrogenase [Polynucleobacter sp. SHI8]|uniref:FAD binding domain-containing protein n=1 Tax=unclassified Polynucleobacter TaxID=2640945 RepID=UPI0024916E0F|nr:MULTISPECIES: FAD binding domain-containing protein [unclassified Polynucleobacter]BDW11300.1 carbon monoxide dehydrogenase [Polynucleobacter sp. SHI2]BDW13746.1 carbon monoxide dehydrogenase [Polynucleobacter sp. SHI8]
MKAAPFDYHLAENLSHTKNLLKEYGEDVKLIAGGQSLVPMMAMRLAKPSHLIDIARIDELQLISSFEESIRIGAGVKQCVLENHSLTSKIPLLSAVVPWIGHHQTRNRGTVGGSLAHADPSAELPLIAVILQAQIHCDHLDTHRIISAKDFFLGPMWTTLDPQECLTHIDWPIWQGHGIGHAFEETSIRQGDFAMASAATQLQVDASGKLIRLHCGVGGMGGTPYSFEDMASPLIGQTLSKDMILAFSEQAIQQTEPASDLHANAAYRRNLAKTLLSRTIEQSLAMAINSFQHHLR